MFCPNCGFQMNDNATFCPYCGMKTNRQNVNSINMNSIVKYVIVALVVVIAIFLVKGLFISKTIDSNVINNEYLSEEDKCENDFIIAMNDFKSGDITSLKKHIVGENLGSIEELLQLFNINSDNVNKMCRVLFSTFDFNIESLTKNNNGFIVKTKVIMPNSNFMKVVSTNIMSKFDITDIGVFLGARESKITKIIDKIIDGYTEININDYGYDNINYDIEMIKVDGDYKINNFSNFFDNSQFGKFITNIRPIINIINSILN